jgi:hypothetical protein
MPIHSSKIMDALQDKEDLELVAGGCSYNTIRVLNVSSSFEFSFKFILILIP